jgi:hypothetical protein
MSTLTPRANFNANGLAIGQNNVNMTYLYGLSDFFHLIFEDSSTLNLLLEAESEYAGNVYSRFLQLTSTLSLESIQETLGTTIKLILISESDAVIGEENVYNLTTDVVSSRYIANRPFLPTTLWETSSDYLIQTNTSGQIQIRFARDISEAGFSTRITSTGEIQYALWFVDANIDEQLLSNYYGSLIGVAPEASSDAFYNFIYGLYYMYTQGPTLSLITKGLNLVLGIPLSRANETVLDIRTYLETDQYIVITTENQYVIPYGISPSVSVGDVLATGTELAQWIIVQDYINDGDWWLNLHIPSTIIPYVPEGQKDRYATSGTIFDYLMRNYLKKHTFLVNIRVDNFKDVQNFQQVSDIIKHIKPTYTQAIYIWTVTNLDETLTLSDDDLTLNIYQLRCENITLPIHDFYRNNTVNPVPRDCPKFLRWSVPYSVTELGGTNPYLNSFQPDMDYGQVNGIRNPRGGFANLDTSEQAWARNICRRDSETWVINRSVTGMNRSSIPMNVLDGTAVNTLDLNPGQYAIPLYITTQQDIITKCTAVGVDVPPLTQWIFEIPSLSNSQAIDTFAIDDTTTINTYNVLTMNYSTLFFRGSQIYYLGPTIPQLGQNSWAPDISYIQPGDYLLGVRISDNSVGIYWVTTYVGNDLPPYAPVAENESLAITFNAPINRNKAATKTPFYLTRGQGDPSGTPVQTYTDSLNNNVPIDRSGRYITHGIYRQ